MQFGILEWILKQKKSISEKAGEIWMKSRIQLKWNIISFFDKCTTNYPWLT